MIFFFSNSVHCWIFYRLPVCLKNMLWALISSSCRRKSVFEHWCILGLTSPYWPILHLHKSIKVHNQLQAAVSDPPSVHFLPARFLYVEMLSAQHFNIINDGSSAVSFFGWDFGWWRERGSKERSDVLKHWLFISFQCKQMSPCPACELACCSADWVSYFYHRLAA